MIIGVGIDLVEVNRFRELISKRNFLSRFFSKNEINLDIQSLAGRFAARESLYKALPDKVVFKLSDIEVIKERDGRPEFIFHNELLRYFQSKKVFLSISHTIDNAIAVVIIESIE